MKRVIGKLNTVTSDGRIIRKIHLSEDPIPVLWSDGREPPERRIVGTATVRTDGDDIVADIDLRYVGQEDWSGPEIVVTNFEDLNPHMSCVVVNLELDEMALASIFLDDQPDAFGDLNT